MKYLYSLICALVCAPVCFTNHVTADGATTRRDWTAGLTDQQKQARITAYNNVFASNPQFSGYQMNSQGKVVNPSGTEVRGVWKQLPPAARDQIRQAVGKSSN